MKFLSVTWLILAVTALLLITQNIALTRDEPGTSSSNLVQTPIWEQGPTEADYPSLMNLKQFTPQIYSGGEPKTEAAFKAIKELGAKTVVSVDGARPKVELAEKYGLRYVHIPIGYDGVPEEAALALTKLMQETSEPIYFHCHHGKHRGPAAAAVACQIAGQTDPTGALQILEAAGTSRNYNGLWRDVGQFKPVAEGIELPELVSVAAVDSLAQVMANIDRNMDHLKASQKAGWRAPSDHPDLDPPQEALLIKESFREAARLLSDKYDHQFRRWLNQSEMESTALEQSLRQNDKDLATQRLNEIAASCKQCHNEYRN